MLSPLRKSLSDKKVSEANAEGAHKQINETVGMLTVTIQEAQNSPLKKCIWYTLTEMLMMS